MRKIASVVLSCLMAATAQQPPPPPATNPDGLAKFASNSQLVVEVVTVHDKDGKSIEGLTAKDFTITENNTPQTIKFCEFEKLPDNTDFTPQFSTRKPEGVEVPKGPPLTQIAPETPGDIRYRNRRLLTLYFDMSAMPVPDQLRAFDAATRFIKTKLTAADLVAVMEFSNGAVKVRQDFSDDRDQLMSTLNAMLTAAEGLDEDGNDLAAASDPNAAFGQNDGEFNIFNTDRKLAALQTAVKILGTLNEKKALIYFASGLNLNGTDNQAQLRSTLNSAIRANVSFYPVDARGLVAALENSGPQMNVVDVQQTAGQIDVHALHVALPAILPRQVVLHVAVDRKPAEDDVAELVAAHMPRRSHHPSHAERRADFLDMAVAVRTGTDYFLQRDDVGADVAEDTGDSVRFGPAIHAAAAVNVVGDDAQRIGAGCRKGRYTTGCQKGKKAK
jgi:VWFA-related protein